MLYEFLHGTLDFYGYPMNYYSFLIYVLVLSLSLFFLKKQFGSFQTIVLSVLTVLCLELLWEYPANLLNAPLLHWTVFLRQLTISFPIILWIYYHLRFGKGSLLIWIVPAISFEFFILLSPSLLAELWWNLPFLPRLVFASAIVVNVRSWRNTLS